MPVTFIFSGFTVSVRVVMLSKGEEGSGGSGVREKRQLMGLTWIHIRGMKAFHTSGVQWISQSCADD